MVGVVVREFTHSGPFCLITYVEKASNAVLSVDEIVILDETESIEIIIKMAERLLHANDNIPFAHVCLLVHHRLGADNLTKSGSIVVKHCIRCVGMQSTYVNIGGIESVL